MVGVEISLQDMKLLSYQHGSTPQKESLLEVHHPALTMQHPSPQNLKDKEGPQTSEMSINVTTCLSLYLFISLPFFCSPLSQYSNYQSGTSSDPT